MAANLPYGAAGIRHVYPSFGTKLSPQLDRVTETVMHLYTIANSLLAGKHMYNTDIAL